MKVLICFRARDRPDFKNTYSDTTFTNERSASLKRIVSLFMALILVVSIAIPAYASERVVSPQGGSIRCNSQRNYDIGDPPGPYDSEPADLGVPKITCSRYMNIVVGYFHCSWLQFNWNAIDGAERYEVEIRKADRTTKVYTSMSTSLFLINTGSPNVCLENKSTWVGSRVRVRALAKNSIGNWSAAYKIAFNGIY